MSHIFDKVRIYTTRNHKQENYIPISPYGKNNEFRPIYLESKFPVCVVRHVCKNLWDHLQDQVHDVCFGCTVDRFHNKYWSQRNIWVLIGPSKLVPSPYSSKRHFLKKSKNISNEKRLPLALLSAWRFTNETGWRNYLRNSTNLRLYLWAFVSRYQAKSLIKDLLKTQEMPCMIWSITSKRNQRSFTRLSEEKRPTTSNFSSILKWKC